MKQIVLSLVLSQALLVTCEIKVVDLTWDLGEDAIRWPGNQPFLLHPEHREQLPYATFEVNTFRSTEHIGTHLNAPSQFRKDGLKMHQIPAERLIGPGVVIDVTKKARLFPHYEVSMEDINEYEEEYGKIPEGAIVFMKSGWSKKYPDRKRVFNTQYPEYPDTFRTPGFHYEAVSWLANNRKIGMIGVDTPSVDIGKAEVYNVHVTCAKYNVFGLENVANLEEIPVKGATIFVGAMKIVDGSGGPVRLLAQFDPDAPLKPPKHTEL